MNGFDLIIEERKRQITLLGLTVEHIENLPSITPLLKAADCFMQATTPDTPAPPAWPFDTALWQSRDWYLNIASAGALYWGIHETTPESEPVKKQDFYKFAFQCAELINKSLDELYGRHSYDCKFCSAYIPDTLPSEAPLGWMQFKVMTDTSGFSLDVINDICPACVAKRNFSSMTPDQALKISAITTTQALLMHSFNESIAPADSNKESI